MKATNICFVALVAVLIVCLQNIDGKRCAKNYFCPNTTLNINNANIVERNAAYRRFIRDILTSRYLNGISNTAQKFTQYVVSNVNTDSQSLLNTFAAFTFYAIAYVLYAPSTPSLCILARNINGSVSWARDRDGNQTAAALTSIANNVNTLCTMLETTSLLELGCENVTDPPPITRNCYNRGYAFDVNSALNLFGQNLPCSLYDGILDLYDSPNYVDKLLSAAMTVALTPEAQNLINSFDANQLLEPSYMVLNNNVSVCCCSKRRARFNVLCSVVTSVTNSSVINAIENTYLVDECATEVNH